MLQRSLTRWAYEEAARLEAPWANDLAEGLTLDEISTTQRIIAELRRKLDLADERGSI